MKPYLSFKLFISIREHFKNKKYDYFEKRGKHFLNSPDKFKTIRPQDKRYYEQFAREYSDSVRDFYVANFAHDSGIKWIGSLDNNDAHSLYLDYIKFRQAPQRYFKNSIDSIVNHCESENITFKKFLLMGSGFDLTDIHTRNILNQLTKFGAKRDPLYDAKNFQLENYAKFVSINSLDEYAHILKDKLKHLKT